MLGIYDFLNIHLHMRMSIRSESVMMMTSIGACIREGWESKVQ